MRIQFCGADRTVTGSCHLIEVNGVRIFLDMGMYQGPREEARRINQYLVEDAQSVDAIILSHGHFDHCGKLPVVTRAGFHGPIYCTPATADVARIVLEDAAEIQVEDAIYLNKRSRDPGAKPIEPLYTPRDIPPVVNQFRTVEYGKRTEIGKGLFFTFYDAGHILGSAYVVLEWNEDGQDRRLLFTADIGRYDTPIIRDPHPLEGPVDHIISESTYGDRLHAPMSEVEPQLLDALQFCIENRSRLVVPSFALGRSQTMLWYVQKFIEEKKIPPLPIFIDSPMAIDITKVYVDHYAMYDQQTRDLIGQKDLFGLSRATFTRSRSESQKINSYSGACVIISSSPSCEFGRILHHLKQSIERPNDIVLFVGWTPLRTLGRRLQDGERRLRILDRWYDLKCQVRTLHGLSAHADGEELIRYLKPVIAPDVTAYIVHGEDDQAEGFARRLLAAGIGRTVVPAMETSIIDI
jgi:metallo-beta-lactamase family protein